MIADLNTLSIILVFAAWQAAYPINNVKCIQVDNMDDIWNCPSCGDDLHDVGEAMKEKTDETSFEVLNSLLGYYCENCNNFYGKESLKDELHAP
jgi:uncharacterized protein with PIN domain